MQQKTGMPRNIVTKHDSNGIVFDVLFIIFKSITNSAYDPAR
jgi:hypothetical protein